MEIVESSRIVASGSTMSVMSCLVRQHGRCCGAAKDFSSLVSRLSSRRKLFTSKTLEVLVTQSSEPRVIGSNPDGCTGKRWVSRPQHPFLIPGRINLFSGLSKRLVNVQTLQ